MYHISSVIVLFIVTCVDSNGLPRTFPGCEGRSDIYIQWVQPISGWYQLNLSSSARRQYRRKPPAADEDIMNTTLLKYEFTLEFDGRWNLSQWTKRRSKSILKTINETSLEKFPKITNIVPEASASAKSRVRREHPEKFQIMSEKSKSIKKKRGGISLEKVLKKPEIPVPKETIPEMVKVDKEDKEPSFFVYCPSRCRCLKAEAMDREFTRLDALSNEVSEACYKNLSELSDLPDEIRDAFLKRKNEAQTNNRHSSIKNNTYEGDEMLQSWQAEFYVSDDCTALLYFDKTYDFWIADFEFLSKKCLKFDEDGLQTYYSADSAPCLEYLPIGSSQKWENLQLQENLNGPQNNSATGTPFNYGEEPIDNCDRNFTMRPSVRPFNVTCTKLEHSPVN